MIIDQGDKEVQNTSLNKYALACALVASMVSIVSGYDTGVMSGAMIFIKEDLGISDTQQEILAGILNTYHVLSSRFYDLAGLPSGILKKGREVLLTGCYLRTTAESSGHPRLLPTEYLVILLDENQDDDAMLLGAQFCSDSFSSISLEAVNNGASYSLYARIENIESAEIRGNFGTSQRKQITLVDGDGVALNFFLWSEQVLLANLFRVGCMLALDKPYVASSAECGIQTNEEFCLEYGSATQLYLVPYIQHEEQLEELLMSIGRAILKDPKILLLDEATSALDAECACIDTNLCICMFFLNLGDFLVQKLGEGVKGVYISIDVDCLDPAFAPGVSHIEPGGLSFRDVLNILHNLQGDVVAGDVVELNPQRDTVDGMTAMVAAKLVREMVAKIAK
ncbi:unnamed protein product [Vicia faba]|uniref:Cell division control protein 24 OB domain-containing protein n=1 Tax=Vicia faba TaxID=3906 RepID=A0AAV0ZQJ2_VICFA|nr:unnamed protein product [Vicia faba]CAI8600524.1 unnamed protein product [Vicia faba]CAI8612401.1 unnamed protein product [Vicia faba]